MLVPLKTDDEEGRARALERYEILDTEAEKPFENVVNLVQQTLRVPMCAVSLVDRHRQWFKARRGLDVSETPREISFCTLAINGSEPFIISNAAEHPLFCENPLVTNEPGIRAYAGIPLTTPDGYNIGTLCAIDDEPREFGPEEIRMLESFARIVMNELELRQAASCDPLTDALTRGAWTDRANEEIERARRYGRPLSASIIDIDRFKSVNDTYGHPAGDKVLRQLASTISNGIRQSDLFGRLGGEEFGLLMPEIDGADAYAMVERLRLAFAGTPARIGADTQISCTFSAGVAELAVPPTLDFLLATADKCLYQAKRGGRDRTELEVTVPPLKVVNSRT